MLPPSREHHTLHLKAHTLQSWKHLCTGGFWNGSFQVHLIQLLSDIGWGPHLTPQRSGSIWPKPQFRGLWNRVGFRPFGAPGPFNYGVHIPYHIKYTRLYPCLTLNITFLLLYLIITRVLLILLLKLFSYQSFTYYRIGYDFWACHRTFTGNFIEWESQTIALFSNIKEFIILNFKMKLT